MKVLINGQLIEYKKEGGGNAILLLHGWGASLQTFDQLAAFLVGKGYAVYRFDFPGFGASPVPAGDWSVSDYAELTAGFIKKFSLKSVVMMGHSFGGRVIIKGVADGVLSPKKVVLMGSAGVKPRSSLKKTGITVLAKTGKAVTALPGMKGIQAGLRKKLYAATGSSDYLMAGPMKKIFLNTINEDLSLYFEKLTAKTLLIWGHDDSETPVEDGKAMQAAMSHSRLVVIPGAGHFVYVDAPGDVFREIGAFL